MAFFNDRKSNETPDLIPVKDVVSSRIWDAMVDASAQLTKIGVRHALVGGLAIGAHGWPRTTGDVDFIVDDTAWVKHAGGIVSPRPGLPIQVHGVAIDNIATRDDEDHLLAAIDAAETSEGIPVLPVDALVYMKLVSPRAKDRLDIIELVRVGGVYVSEARAYLELNAPRLVSKFEDLVAQAESEEA